MYLARDLFEDGREVALKVFDAGAASSEAAREFRVLRELRHPGIARAYDFGRLPGRRLPYLTLEYADGPDLSKQASLWRRRATQGGLAQLLDVFLQVATALDYLHQKGLLHLDLKPANIVVSGGKARLIDFGLFENARWREARPARGTAHFMAPELFEGGPIDRRADLYALGVTMFRSLAGRYPISGRSVAEIAASHRGALPPPLSRVPEALSRLVLKLLAKSPQHRVQSAGEVAAALRALMPQSPLPASPSAPQVELDFVGRRRELDGFFRWFEGLRKGDSGRVLAVEGGPGSGKSRFVEACVTEMLGHDAAVVGMRSVSARDAGVLRLLVDRALTLSPLAPRERPRWRFLFTALGLASDARSRKEIDGLPLEAARARLFSEIVELLARAARGVTVFVVEDLHAADAQFCDFLRRFAQERSAGVLRSQVGFLVTCRSDGAGSGLAEMLSSDAVLRLPLGSMSPDESLALVRAAGPTLGAARAAELVRAGGGNPGLLLQLVESAAGGEGVGEQSRAGVTPIDAVLRRRIEALDARTGAVFLALLLVRRPVDETVLATVTRLRRVDVRAARAVLERSGIAKGGRHGLSVHGILARDPQTLGFELATVRRQHERIGRCLARDPGRLREAAHHLLQGGVVELGVRSAEESGLRLTAAGRVEEALDVLREALEFCPQSPVARRIAERVGELEERCGRFDEAARRYEELVAVPDLPGADRLRLLRKLGGVRQRRGENEAARAAFEQALDLIDTVPDLGEQLYLFQELSALYLFAGDFARAATFANRGLEVLAASASSLGRDAYALHSLNFHAAAGHVLLRQNECRQAAAEFAKGLAFAERIDALSSVALLLNNLGIAYSQDNRLGKALQVYARAASIARRLGDDTALFSIRCNVAMIRARRGEMDAAGELLAAAEAMPQGRRSKRASLFLLHSRALVERLVMSDSRVLWDEAIRMADALPDPLFAGHGRMCLFENEILQGRWAHAREVLGALRSLERKDARLDRAVAARAAYLEAMCGRSDEAAALLARLHAEPTQPQYADLWDDVYRASALVELGELRDAAVLLVRTRRVFERSGQLPSVLECTLLLVESSLRARDAKAAVEHVREATRSLSRHRSSSCWRRADVRLPYLEARVELERGAVGESRVLDRVVDAAGSLAAGSTTEIVWLLDLVAAEGGGATRRKRASAALRRFAASLTAADRRAYLARDHRLRLGLGAPAAGGADRELAYRYGALLRLASPLGVRLALQAVVDGARARRGAIFTDRKPGVLAAHGFGPGARGEIEQLRAAAMRSGSGTLSRGTCVDVSPPGSSQRCVLYVEASDKERDGPITRFLGAAGRILGHAVIASLTEVVAVSDTTRVVRESNERTQGMRSGELEQSRSPKMQELVSTVLRTRESQLPVLITGESGAGKDHVARWIHGVSPRAQGPFVAQDCAAVPEGLLEADIFGFEEGAFTGADRAKTGYIFTAIGGSYYLDNVDALPLGAQAKLLRVLEERAVRPLGGRAVRKADVRVIASSQRDLTALSLRGEFRKDLYYRLAGISLHIPPLRERADDIPALVKSVLEQIPGSPRRFTPGAFEALRAHAWPGNVRELESVVRRLLLTTDGDIDARQVGHVLFPGGAAARFPRWVFAGRTDEEVVDDVKREYLLLLFERFDGDLAKIARELKTTRRNVYLRFASAGLRLVDLRAARP